MLELHIWGPAFGLPSFDAECLATLHYLRHALPVGSWSLVPSSNPNLNPFHRLPSLRDGSTWVAGFDQIHEYLSHQSHGEWDINQNLDETQKADCIAYTSFLYSRGLPLVDLSLYISSDNYSTCTRSALGDLLTWPQSWTIPHQLREQARSRSEHLGLSALDVDTAQDENDGDGTLAAQIPKSLRKPKQTVSSLLGRSAQKTRFRLDAVTEEFLEPLSSRLLGRDWLVANRLTSADCIAIAMLSLMQTPELPHPWLREALSTKYSALGNWARSQAFTVYGNDISVSSAIKGEPTADGLPWSTSAALSWTESGLLAVEAVVSSLPILRQGYERHEVPVQHVSPNGEVEARQEVYIKLRRQQRMYSQVVATSFSAASLLGWMAYIGLLALPRFYAAKPSRRNFGAAGAILGL